MTRLVLRRVLRVIPVILVIYTITFALFKVTPGSPFQQGPKPLPVDTLAALERQYGLDRPWYVQYASYLWNALHWDFGPSYSRRGQTVEGILGGAIPVTAQLAVAAMAIGALLGVALGMLAAVHRNTWVDYLSTGAATLGISIPPYVAISVLVVLLSVQLGWLEPQGWHGLFSTSAIIPVLALCLEPIAVFARYTRASTLEVLGSDFVRTAEARGLRRRTILGRHVLKNALVPVLTIGGLEFAVLLGGSFFVETIANVPGLGRATVSALQARDFPVIMATVLISAVAIVLVNMVVDVLYLLVDPRIEVTA